MRKRFSIIVIFLITSISIYSQTAGIRVVHPVPDSVLSWSIRNDAMETVISGEYFQGEDSVEFDLPADKRFYLDVSGYAYTSEDTTLLMLELYGEPIMILSNALEPGDHMYPFHTGKKPSQLKIIGGENASIEDFPWQVYFRTGNYMCGGSIIGEDWIITAAHCIFDDNGDTIPESKMYVRVGTATPYISTTGKIYYIDQAIVHEEYNADQIVNDIALLKLKEPIDFENATAIELVSSLDVAKGATDPGVISTVTGWGKSNVNPDEFPEILQKVDLPIVSNETAMEVWNFYIPETELTAGYRSGNKDACNGDSGGPLVVETDNGLKLAGIVSWGSTLCNTYGAYTRISSYEEWIRIKTGIEARYTPPAVEGDSIICPEAVSTSYTAPDVDGASNYEWSFEPAEAGSLSQVNAKLINIDWIDGYLGAAKIKYRIDLSGETTPWSVTYVNRVKATSITSQPADSNLCALNNLPLQVTAEGYNLVYNFYKNDIFLEQNEDGLYKINLASSYHSGTYNVVAEGSCGTKETDPFTVSVIPVTDVNSITGDQVIAYGDQFSLEVDASGDDLHYQWYKDGELTAFADNYYYESLSANTSNTGIYKVLVSGTCGSEQSSETYVYVSQEEVQNESGIELWPTICRISDGQFQIAVKDDVEYNVSITGLNGEVLYRQDGCTFNTVFNPANFSKGIYLVTVIAGSSIETFKLILY